MLFIETNADITQTGVVAFLIMRVTFADNDYPHQLIFCRVFVYADFLFSNPFKANGSRFSNIN